MRIGDGPIYCIHREVDIDRYTNLTKELSKLDEKYVIVEPKLAGSTARSRVKSLRETTIELVEKARDNNEPCISIIEDDCKIDGLAYELFNKQDFPENFDFIHLTITGPQRYGFKLTNNVFRQIQGGLGCVFYVIGSSIYDRYIELLKDNDLPIDEITKYLHAKRSNSYVVTPSPAYHEVGKHSTLKDKIVEY